MAEAVGEGNIAMSRDLPQLLGLIAGAVMLLTSATRLRDSMIDMIVVSTRTLDEANFMNLKPFLATPMRVGFSICLAATVASIIGSLIQTKGRLWGNRLFKGLEMSAGALKRMFSMEMLTDLGISMVKAVTVGWAVWSALGAEFLTLPLLLLARPDAQFGLMFQPLEHGAVKVLTTMAMITGLDLAVTHYRHRKAMKMTKSDVKREARDDEGDPTIKGRRRRAHRDLLRGIAAVEVPRATALVVNPTHFAIAIRYRPGEDKAPIVTAKGKDALAEFMRDLARSNGIPIVQDVPLARLLYKKVKIGRAVPAETYKAVAAVLAFVYRVTGRRPSPPAGRSILGPSRPRGPEARS